MRITSTIFTVLTLFFLLVGAAYGLLTGLYEPFGVEPMGFPAILMLGGLCAMIAAVTRISSNREKYGLRPEDDAAGEVSDEAGLQGSFSPYSWWPIATALAAALVFLGVAAGWWIAGLGAVVAIYAVTGWVMEFSIGQHAH